MSKTSLVTSYVPEMFKDVHPGWKKILLSSELKPILNKCLNKLDKYLRDRGVNEYYIKRDGLATFIRPAPENIFEPFKYFDPQNLIAILAGQDPFTKREEAQGVCFSVPKGVPIPRSTKNIYSALSKSKQIDSEPDHGNLIAWARQGVLMINRYLTRSPNIKKNEKGEVWIEGNGDSTKPYLHDWWAEFTTALIKYLTNQFVRTELNHPKHYLGVMLWGNKAQELSVHINPEPISPERKLEILTYAHPSPLSGTDFSNCQHFAMINSGLSAAGLFNINWDPNAKVDARLMDRYYILRHLKLPVPAPDLSNPAILYDDRSDSAENKAIRETLKQSRTTKPVSVTTPVTEPPMPIVVAIDGACEGNGDEDANAGYGAYFPAKVAGKVNGIHGGTKEQPKAICVRGELSTSHLQLDTATLELKPTTGEKKGTNGRAELLAWIQAVLHILRHYRDHPEEPRRPIYMVCDAEYTINLVNERIWRYVQKDPKLESVNTNRDLVLIINQLLPMLVKVLPSGAKVGGDEKLSITQTWDIVMQPNAHDHYKTKKPMEMGWHGLTMFYQESHMKKKDIPKPTEGWTYEKWLFNERVDGVAKEGSRLTGHALVPKVTEDV